MEEAGNMTLKDGTESTAGVEAGRQSNNERNREDEIDSDGVMHDEHDLTLEKTNHSTKSIAETLSLPREALFVAVVCSAQFTTQAALGQTLAILHIIGDSFHLSNPGELSWLIAGYSLTVGSFILVAGRLGDMFGYKRMLIIGYCWFAIWSIVAGLAVYSNHVLFVFARVLQGIGPSLTMTNGLALLGATYAPGRRKNMVFSFFGATAPGGSIVGAVFASLFSMAWWPWAFWSFGIAMAGIAAVAVVVVPDPPRKANVAMKTLHEKIIDLDIPGAVVGITALVVFNFAWNQAPLVGWQQPYVYVLLIVGILLVPLFFFIELRIVPDPLIPFHALSRDVSFVLGCIACGWGCFGALASVCTGWLLGHLRPSWVMTIALSCFTIGAILCATAPPGQSYWAQTFVCLVIMPWGMDMSFPAATVILSNSVERHHQGIAASLINTVVNYSISLALGFAGTIETQINNGGTTKADTLKGYRGAFYMAIGLAGLGVCLSLSYVFVQFRDDMKEKKEDDEKA
ncbi:putative mfs transporter of unknown specificity [Phaeomoniella chlamydospora]|uniref:Major facilitator superfamily (MFS) profile domain-containing protein n=1 Tax=Phaeomoniella chlamydospora TaxID=158046 RepID=A0A0G2E719_PHACM|nr:putative mfs transporter of unknown specificity [Phaeomoniella chlamydospora]